MHKLPIQELVELYKDEKSTTAIGKIYGVSANAINTRLSRAGVEIRRCGPQNRASVNLDVHGYPRSLNRCGEYCTLHRAIWEAYNGEIPKGYLIHHVDGNRGNFDIDNLDCLTYEAHGRLHAA